SGPIIREQLVKNKTVGFESLDPIGAGSKRRIESGLRDVAPVPSSVLSLPPVLRKHCQLADYIRQLANARLVEREQDLPLARLLSANHVAIMGRQLWMKVFEG